MDNTEIDVIALQKEMKSLKTAYKELEDRYNQLDSNHKEYKLDIEFQRDISNLCKPIGDEDKEVLKDLKASGNEKAYNLILNSFKTVTSTGGLGSFAREFNSSNIEADSQSKNRDAFTEAINDLKGE